MADSKKKYKFNATSKQAWADSGVNFLKGSKVGSASGYVVAGGVALAIPHRMPRVQTAPSGLARFQGKTEYSDQFRDRQYCYCSMPNKPLRAYSPLAPRSRLAVEDPPIPFKSASSIRFGGGLHNDKHRFVTTHQSFFTGEPCDLRSNPGILSQHATFRRRQRES
eukprot:gb/GFBE01040623.1/.p1 GENE.gb/GFBE01040623.1/~~gb/GFBE01040623.1/.p1  ORF type:complete len:165 (+),score=29.30 gb/GFBE01040623.1/:1-495(+)